MILPIANCQILASRAPAPRDILGALRGAGQLSQDLRMGWAYWLWIPYLRKKRIFSISPDILHFLLMNLDVVTRVFKVLFIPFQSIKKIEKRLINRWENWYFVRDLGNFWANTWILSENSSIVDVLLYKSLWKLLDIYILADFSKVSHKISIFSLIYQYFPDFFDVLKRYEQHLGNSRNHT